MNGSCSEKAVRRFNEVLEKTIKSPLTRSHTNKAIDKAIKDLSFLHEGLKLTHNDPSYVFRYLYAIKFWKEESKEKKIEDKSRLESLKKELIKQLKQKENLFLDADGEEFVDNFDGLTNLAASRADTRDREQIHGYVTTITQTKVFVKPVGEPCQPPERELEVGKDEILSFSYGFIYPGDKVEVSAFASHNGIGRNLTILKSTKLSSTDETKFIQQFKNSLLPEDSDAFSIFNEMCERSKGIWDYITNDESVQENTENMKDILKVSSLLSEKLSKGKETSCQMFLENLASSAFFVKLLPDFIKVSVKDKDSDETRDIATLLKLMVKLSPSSSKNVFKLAHCLGNQLIDSRPDVRGGATTNHNNCHWSTRLLVDLGNILTGHIQGSQEVASYWHELPTILTQKEIFPGETERDISDLDAIKREKPYESTCQYLEINYRLLREECFRNLYTGIRKFCESPEEYDPRKIQMFKITLHDICLPSDSEVTIRLKYNAYKEVGKQDSEEECKEVLYGNLMCISLDKKFKYPVWATIGNSAPKEHLKYSNTKIVCVKLCSERNTMDDAKVLLKLQELTEKGDHALMAESPTFFQAFGPSMERLQEAQRSDNMPFKEEIIHAEKSKAPEYTEDKKQKDCDWGIIFKKQKGCKFEVPKDEDFSPLEMYKFLRKEKTSSELDETQLLAIQNVLERRVALIQGPPGTGKSFLGTKIVRLMLSMEIQKRYNGPILVMTYKNVALDHFLKTCMEYCPKVLRIGRAGRDTSDELKEINLNNARKKVNLKKSLIDKRKKVNTKMKSSQSKLTTSFKNLTNPQFTLKLFLQAAEKSHVRSLLTESPDKNQNDEENSKVEDLLSEWEKTGAEDCSARLKDMVKISLNKWLPKQKLEEKYQLYSENKVESEIQNKNRDKNSKLPSNEKNVDNDDDEARDSKEIMKERLQDADEEGDSGELFSEITNTQDDEEGRSEGGISIPLAFLDKEATKKALTKIENVSNLWEESEDERVNFVYALHYKVMEDNVEEFTTAAKEYNDNCKILQEIKDSHTVETMRQYEVIGMTITGAAMRLKLLNEIKPCAVIVEEAAEIIEGQLISVLPPTAKHLVMLGDQKQLKPFVSCYELKKQKNLDCSMFERLINNHMDYQQLGTQCRMRDDIADLLRNLNIYTDLNTNKEKTGSNHPPGCIEKSMFFLEHTSPEEDLPGSSSKINQTEINEILKVAKYLVKNDYPPEDVTVLCAYRGQVVRMEGAFKKTSLDPTEESFTKLRDIKITTVDSFQGEENKVILLSLVRTNKKERIGFFAEQNRICVAVSRAKCALYFFGNATLYKGRSKDWKAIIDLLEKRKLVGSRFPFKDDRAMVMPVDASGQLLTLRLVELIGSNTTTKWDRLARLLNMKEAFVEDIRRNYALYPDALSKAVKVLEKYKEDSEFDVTELVDWLKYLDIKIPNELSKASKPSEAKSSSRGVETKHSQKSTRYKDKFEKLLTLDSREIQRIGPVLVCFDREFLIGKGRNSVYIGLHEDGSEVAVKRILTDKSSFENEVGILDLVNLKKSDHIVNYRAFISDESDDFSYIILDLCEENLEEYVKKHDKEFLERHGPVIIREILTGLQALHCGEKKVLHRDLKPRNILVDVEGHMRLADFGVSRVLKNDETSVVTSPHGTEDWMAAESIPKTEDDDVRFKRKSDIQVAGMICFYVLTKGDHPFGGRYCRMQNIMNDSPVNLDRLTDPNANRFVSWLISHEIKDRPYVDDALADCFLQVLPDVWDNTQLSPREIERLSSEHIVSSWQRLAGLLNLFEKEVDDVLQSQLYPQPRQKAAKCLNLYNHKHEKFSRNDLAKYLEEIKLLQASKEVLDGTLRKK